MLYSIPFHRLVDGNIVNIIRQRYKECITYESPDHVRKCQKLKEDFENVSENYFIKCKLYSIHLTYQLIFILFSYHPDGDLGPYNNVKEGYMKQKHRMLWERRHGEVGTGMKNQDAFVH